MKIEIIAATLLFSAPLASYGQVNSPRDNVGKQGLASPSDRAVAQQNQSVYRPGSRMAEIIYEHNHSQQSDTQPLAPNENKDISR